MRTCLTLRRALFAFFCAAGTALGQESPTVTPADTPSGTPDTPHLPLGEHRAEEPGLVHLGPFYLTPLLRIGTVGLDTNVFYTPSDRQVDVSGSGGPGLRIVVPVASGFRFASEGAF